MVEETPHPQSSIRSIIHFLSPATSLCCLFFLSQQEPSQHKYSPPKYVYNIFFQFQFQFSPHHGLELPTFLCIKSCCLGTHKSLETLNSQGNFYISSICIPLFFSVWTIKNTVVLCVYTIRSATSLVLASPTTSYSEPWDVCIQSIVVSAYTQHVHSLLDNTVH